MEKLAENFRVHDLYALEAVGDTGTRYGITLVSSMIESQCRPQFNGLELLEDAQLNKRILSTGCERIDLLLQGGLRVGHVTELAGPSSSGKTQVCLKVASHVARKYSGTVMYFDSGNSFSPKRIVQFLTQESDPANTEIGCNVRMLIIDSLSSLIAPVLGGGGAHGHALMVTAGFLLKELAHEHNLSIVVTIALTLRYFLFLGAIMASSLLAVFYFQMVTNHMVAGEAGSSKPALGDSWKSIPHVRLLLHRYRATNDSCISILKHPYLVQAKNHAV
ncbi:UNVERIFIED_CONTAM: DNA repair protein RAD51 [Sesamum indicum]